MTYAGRAALDRARPAHDAALEAAVTEAENTPELADLVKAVTG